MAQRLVEIVLPEEFENEARDLLKDEPVLGVWNEGPFESNIIIKVILEANKTEKVMDDLENRFGRIEGFRVVLLPVEAAIPRIKEETPDKEPQSDDSSRKKTESAGRNCTQKLKIVQN